MLTTLHRKKEKKEEEETPLYATGYVISPPSHLDETSEIPEGPPAYLFLGAGTESNWLFSSPGAAAHNEFRRASKGARSARKAHVVEFNLHVSENCDQPVRALAGILLAASAVGTRLCEN